MTDELGSRLERPIHFECKLNEPMHIHPAATDHSVSISKQQVQRILRFSLRSRAGNPAAPWWCRSRGDGTSPFHPSGNEGYIHNREVPFQSVTLEVMSDDDWRIGIPTKAPWMLPLSVYCGSLLRPLFRRRSGLTTRRPVVVALPTTDWITLGKRTHSTWNRNVVEAPSFPKEVSEALTHMNNRLGAYGN